MNSISAHSRPGYVRPAAYVASKFESQILVRQTHEDLLRIGFVINHDWTNEAEAGRTGLDLKRYLRRCAEEDLCAVESADLFFMQCRPEMRGAFVELGAALIGQCLHEKHKIIVVAPKECFTIFFELGQVECFDQYEQALHRAGQIFRELTGAAATSSEKGS